MAKIFATKRNGQIISHQKGTEMERVSNAPGGCRILTSAEVGDPREFACEQCGAAVGETCKKKDGTPSKTNHPSRLTLAENRARKAAVLELETLLEAQEKSGS